MTLFDRTASDPSLVILEGFHALKHAIRFDADVLAVMTASMEQLLQLGETLAPDILPRVLPIATVGRLNDGLGGRSHWTGVWAVARKREHDPAAVFAAGSNDPIVLLEQPRNLGNVGACIRVAAGANAGGVAILGDTDPWAAAAVRGAAGLQYALPVFNLAELGDTTRPIIALDPDGTDLRPGLIADNAILAFGTERDGLSKELAARATTRLRIPMRAGVSSLNLAVAVGIVLYSGRR